MNAADAIESVNIRDGRRTLVIEPEWFPRPDGLERAVVFQPGYNSGTREYGVHAMEVRWLLRGPNGAAQFLVYTGWTPGHLSPGMGLQPEGCPPMPARQYPTGADLGYHALVPQYEGHEDYGRLDCDVLPGGACYYDGSGLAADRLAKEFVTRGEPAVWAALEERYAGLKVTP